MKYYNTYDTPIGRIKIQEENDSITCVTLTHEVDTDERNKETKLIQKAAEQLEEYFLGKRKKFELPLAPKGTDYQKKVWKALCEIPYGEVRTYKQIAIAVNNPKGSQSVGGANHNNPIMIIIPCHRVIGSNGKLVGYAAGLSVKEKLLSLENKNKD